MLSEIKSKINIFFRHSLIPYINSSKSSTYDLEEFESLFTQFKQKFLCESYLAIYKVQNELVPIYYNKNFENIKTNFSFDVENKAVLEFFIGNDSIKKFINTSIFLDLNNEIIFKKVIIPQKENQRKAFLRVTTLISTENGYIFIILIINSSSVSNKDQNSNFFNTPFQKLFLTNLPVPIEITNERGEILFVNKYFEKLTKYKKNEIIGENTRFLKSGLTPENVYVNLWRKLNSNKPWKGNFVNRKKNGDLYFDNSIIIPHFDNFSKKKIFICIKNDISKQVKLQKGLLFNNKIIQLVLANGNIGYAVVKNNFIFYMNKFFASQFSIDYHFFKINKKILIKDIDETLKISYIIDQTNIIKKFNEVLLLKKSKIWVEITAIKVNSDTILLTTQNITQIKNTENKLFERNQEIRNLINFAKISIISIKSDGTIINFNYYAKSLRISNDLNVGKNILEYIYEEGVSQEELKEKIFTQEIRNFPLFFKKSEKIRTRIELNTSFFKGSEGNVEYILCVINNIQKSYRRQSLMSEIINQQTLELKEALNSQKVYSEYILKMSEENIVQLNEALEVQKNLNILKTDFISKTSHEFRTPLATISMSIDILKKYHSKFTEEQFQDKIGKIQSQTAYMTDLLNDFLLIEKMQNNKIVFTPVMTEFVSFTNKIIDEYRQLNLKFEINFEANEKEIYIMLDENLGKSIIGNLISNAIKYSKELKKIDIKIISQKNFVIIEIKDYGIGIPEEFKKNIFTTFARARNAAVIEGTGLGLSIVKNAVLMHNGEINFESKENIGTKFIVKIPKRNNIKYK